MAIILDGTNGAFLPTWTTATRPASPANGEIGYNSTTAQLDQYVGGAWSSVPTGSAAAATPTALGTVYGNTTPGSGTENCAGGYQALNVATGIKNCAFGTYSGFQITSGTYNTLVGGNSGAGITSGGSNVGVGYQTLASNSGGNNVAVGYQAAYSNVSGGNTAVGYQAFYSNSSGNNATIVGYEAGYNNTTDTELTAFGYRAAYSHTTGSGGGRTTAIGVQALESNTTGYYNTAVGWRALNGGTTPTYNVALGMLAGQVCNGGGNVFVGDRAGNTITSGSNNLYLGQLATASSVSASYEFVISSNQTGKGNNTGFISPNSGGVYQGNNSSSWSTTSDRRLKKNIVDNTEGLDKVSQIRVRNFEYRTEEEVTELPAHTVIKKEGVQLGVIAQELQEVCPDCVKTESTGVISVDSDNIFWHMVNAIKDLKALNNTLTARITALEAR